jgi:Glycine-zipper domain
MKAKRRIPEGKMKMLSARKIGRLSAAVLAVYVLMLPMNSAAQEGGLFVYPLKGQSQEKQDKDRYECHRWAVQQTGFDPSRVNPGHADYLDPQPYRRSQAHVLKGGTRGAALGAVGGAITGNAGKGAAAGAAMGGLAGAFRRRDERRQQETQRRAAANSAASQQKNYIRAISACLEGRGYSVK